MKSSSEQRCPSCNKTTLITDENSGEWEDISLPVEDIAAHISEGQGIIELVLVLTCHGFSISNQLLEHCGSIYQGWGPNNPHLTNIENAVDNFVSFVSNEMRGGE